MSGIAGYKAQLKLGGTPTLFEVEPLTKLSSNVYRIENPIKRVISANHAITVVDDLNNPVPLEAVNYLEGVIKIDQGLAPAEPLLIESAYYIPLLFIGGSKEYTLEIGGDVLDDTAFHTQSEISSGYRSKAYGIHDISASFSRWNNFDQKLIDAKQAQTPIFVSINPGASKVFAKGWFQIETDSLSGDIGALEEEGLSLVLSGNNAKTYFSYAYNYTDEEAQALPESALTANWFPGMDLTEDP